MKTDFPPQNWVVEGLIPMEGMVAVSGDPGSYKTWLLLDMALAVAKGEKFLGQFETNQCGVMIVDEENPARLLQQRLKRMPITEDDLPIQILSLSGFQLTNENARFLLHEAGRLEIGLIIFDSLVRIHDAEENDAKKMAEVFARMKLFIQNGISVIFIHHNRKQTSYGNSAQAMRGSSDILASVDSHIGIKHDEETGIVRMEQTKSRFDKKVRPIEILVEHGKGSTEFKFLGECAGQKRETKVDKAAEAIIEVLLEKDRPLNQTQIVGELTECKKIGRNNVIKALEKLIQEGILNMTKGEKNSVIYTLHKSEEPVEIPTDSSNITEV